MHPSRLYMLGQRHAPQRQVVAREIKSTGTFLKLECGHEMAIAPHFDCSRATSFDCTPCGVAIVENHPSYASEF